MSKHRLARISCATVTLALGASLVVSACSSDKSGTGDGNGSSAGSANGSAAKGGSSSSGAGGGSAAQTGAGSASGGSSTVGTGGSSASSGAGTSGSVPADACPGLPFADSGQAGAGSGEAGASAGGVACTGVSVETQAIPVDMFIMMDRSISLGYPLPNGTTRWDALKTAVQAFVSSPSAGAIGAGIGFFPASNQDEDCSVASYSKPAVAIAPLATDGPDLVQAIGDITPGGTTPVVPALQGALSYASTWATAHPDRATVVVLVTDGYPTECGGSPPDVAAAAQGAYAAVPQIKTYVVGVGLTDSNDAAKFNLNNYAQAGGTKKAFLVDDMSNVSDTFVQTLLNISDSKLACEYAIPKPTDTSMKLDPSKVQVVYTPASGVALEVPKVPALGGCAAAPNGGWFYDDPNTPTKISVCPCTCASFAAGRVDVRLGCSPRISIR